MYSYSISARKSAGRISIYSSSSGFKYWNIAMNMNPENIIAH